MNGIIPGRKAAATGANGYLGAYLTKALVEKGYFVWAIVRSGESDISKIKGLDHCEIIICPLSESDILSDKISCQEIDVCYHLAWTSGAKLRKETISSQAFLIENSVKLMDSVARKGCKRFVGVGTILETNANLPLAHHPNMAYTVAKDCTNKLLALRARELDMQYIWCRLCGLYGGEDETGNLISYTVSKLQQGISPEYSSGSQPYSFIHVEDCANALLCMGGGTWSASMPNLITAAGPECRTIKEYMTTIQKYVAPDVPLKFGVRPDDGIRYTAEMFDTCLLKALPGFQYRHSFEDDIKRMGCSRSLAGPGQPAGGS